MRGVGVRLEPARERLEEDVRLGRRGADVFDAHAREERRARRIGEHLDLVLRAELTQRHA